jgi:hypothetical protein
MLGSGEESLSILGSENGNKLLVVDLSVVVRVRLTDHVIHLLVRQLLTQARHHVTELVRGNQAIIVLVKYPGKTKGA